MISGLPWVHGASDESRRTAPGDASNGFSTPCARKTTLRGQAPSVDDGAVEVCRAGLVQASVAGDWEGGGPTGGREPGLRPDR